MAYAFNFLGGVDPTGPLHSGHLYKKTGGQLAFNKRYFVLYPKVLIYYEHEESYKKDVAKGSLGLCNGKIILEGLYLTKPVKKPYGAKFCFILHCPHQQNKRKEMFLVGENRESRRIWMEKLQELNPALLEPKHHLPQYHDNTLEVPKRWLRADSISGSDDETQNLNLMELSDVDD